jgi:hypothetical protein
VIIAGSRGIINEGLVLPYLDKSPFEITEVVSGGAFGVDRIGEKWAFKYRVPIKMFIPHYDVQNPRNSPLLRNVDMAIYADALLAVWNTESRGTRHMIEQMKKLNKPYAVLEVHGDSVCKDGWVVCQ